MFVSIFRCEGKPKRNAKNYTEKSKLGYKGSREYFDKMEESLSKEDGLVIERLVFVGAFRHVKNVLDSVRCVTNKCF